MNMNTLLIILMFAAGLALGAFYFISLWQTVQKLGQTENRMRLLIISYVLRLAVVLTAFYFMMQGGHWERLAAAMIGFLAMRKILTNRFGPQKAMEAVHE
jgi:F1F0 ATPase subunit 2